MKLHNRPVSSDREKSYFSCSCAHKFICSLKSILDNAVKNGIFDSLLQLTYSIARLDTEDFSEHEDASE